MRVRFRVKHKIIFLVVVVALFVYFVSGAYLLSHERRTLLTDAYDRVQSETRQGATQVQKHLTYLYSLVRNLAVSFSDSVALEPDQWKDIYNEQLRKVYVMNMDSLFALWSSFEISATVRGYDKPYGREYTHFAQTDSGRVRVTRQLLSLTGDAAMYAKFKRENLPNMLEPYRDVTIISKLHQRDMTSLASPVQRDGQFIGMVGCDILLSSLQMRIRNLFPHFQGEVFLLSNRGTIAAHSEDGLINSPLEVIFDSYVGTQNLREVVMHGRSTTFVMMRDSSSRRLFVHMEPVDLGLANGPWSLGVSIPLEVITLPVETATRTAVTIAMISMLLLFIALILITNLLLSPLKPIERVVHQLREGQVDSPTRLRLSSKDNLQTMAESLNVLHLGLKSKYKFVRAVEGGDYDGALKLQSPQDDLGLALLDLQGQLREKRDEEHRLEVETQRRTWSTRGISELSALLRAHSNEMGELSPALILWLSRYIDACQGALYLRDEDLYNEEGRVEFYVETAFAWERKRFLEERFTLGVGLVGACAMELEPIYMTDIPPDYSRIIAGTGDSLPTALVLVPLLHKGEAIAVFEFASFNPIEPYQIEFLQDAAVAAAASLSMLQTARRNAALLEKSRSQAEALTEREEQLRINLESLRQSQEESARRHEDMQNLYASLSNYFYSLDFDVAGYVIGASASYIRRFDRSEESLLNTYFADGLEIAGWNRSRYEEFWSKMLRGGPNRLDVEHRLGDQLVSFLEVYVPILDGEGHVGRVTKFSFEI